MCIFSASDIAKRQTLLYKCDDRNIIDLASICNGHPDCPDASDETAAHCMPLICPTNTFKCDYGACVKNVSICSTGQIPLTQPPVNGGCRINGIPQNGRVMQVAENNFQLNANDIVMNFGLIRYTCNAHYYLNGSDTSFCNDGVWNSPMPDCQPRCSMREISSITYVTHCSLKANDMDEIVRCGSTDLAKPGTVAKIVCERGYEAVTRLEQMTLCQEDGSWSRQIRACEQICGEEG